MQTPQEIIDTAKNYGVPLPETCIELDWQNETLFYWVKDYANATYKLVTKKSLDYWVVEPNDFCVAAPQMHEIARLLPPFISSVGIKCAFVLAKDTLSYGSCYYNTPIHDHHYAQAYAELYLKLK